MILNIYKPIGRTSFSVVKSIKNITDEKKVGHGGTLDPFADGVLIIATGKDTKSLYNVANEKKTYIASLKLGTKTDTLDIEGKITENCKIPKINRQKITTVFNTFLGWTNQIPPMYSAKRINGQRLYKLARKNIEIKRNPTKINIEKLSLIFFDKSIIRFKVSCSKGTYIRVLGSDIAERLGTIGHLSSLTRTRIGNFCIGDSLKIEKFRSVWKSSQT